jgi:DNA-binding MarR family transcriptional regulator
VPKEPLPFDPIEAAQEKWRERWGVASPHAPMAAATAIMRVQQLLLARFDTIAGEHGLTFARYEALVLLAFSRTGALPMGKIGERLMVHPTSATNIVQRLAASGFVERVPNPSDGRGALARITPAGLAAMEAVTEGLHAEGFGLGALDASGLDTLSGLLRTVRIEAGDFVEDTRGTGVH